MMKKLTFLLVLLGCSFMNIRAQKATITLSDYRYMPKTKTLKNLKKNGLTFVAKTPDGNYGAIAVYKIIKEHQYADEILFNDGMYAIRSSKICDINTWDVAQGKASGSVLNDLSTTMHRQIGDWVTYLIAARYNWNIAFGAPIKRSQYGVKTENWGKHGALTKYDYAVGHSPFFIESPDGRYIVEGGQYIGNDNDYSYIHDVANNVTDTIHNFNYTGITTSGDFWSCSDKTLSLGGKKKGNTSLDLNMPFEVRNFTFNRPLLLNVNDESAIIAFLFDDRSIDELKYDMDNWRAKGLLTISCCLATKECKIVDRIEFEQPWRDIAIDPFGDRNCRNFSVDGGSLLFYEYGFKNVKAINGAFDKSKPGSLGYYMYVGVAEDGKIVSHTSTENDSDHTLLTFVRGGKYRQLLLLPDKKAKGKEKYQIVMRSWGMNGEPEERSLINVPNDTDNYSFINTGDGQYDIVVITSKTDRFRLGSFTIE